MNRSLLLTWWKALANERGQIPTSDEPEPTEPGGDTPEPVAPDGEGQPPEDAQAFFDPSQLSPELQAQWKKMQGAYTKKMQQVARVREAAALVDRFNADPEFARQTILQRASALGLNIATTQNGHPMGQTDDKPPEQFVDAVRANLSPELQWMAPTLAKSQWAATKMMMQPLQEQQAQMRTSTRDREFDSLAEQLSQKAPGWEAHEDDMDSLLNFLQSPNMTDRRWGSKLELLYQLVAGPGQATADAARRMASAARFRHPAGQPMATPMPDVKEQVLKPKNNQEAWDAAAKFAIAKLAKEGIRVA